MNEDLLREAYQAFNARDIDAVLTVLHPNVDWANGMESGYVSDHDEVRGWVLTLTLLYIGNAVVHARARMTRMAMLPLLVKLLN